MIMTKEKMSDSSRSARSGRVTAAKPPDGTYALASVEYFNELERLRGDGDDFVILGMILPAAKAAGVCRVLQDERGVLTTPVFTLRKSTGIELTEGRSPSNRIDYNSANHLTENRPSNTLANLKIRDLEIIPGRHEVRVKGKSIALTYSEFRILHTLASHPGWVFDREKIIHAIHGQDYNCTTRAVDVQVTGLRKKLGPAGAYIQTVRGVGYRFVE